VGKALILSRRWGVSRELTDTVAFVNRIRSSRCARQLNQSKLQETKLD
jgi:hypothetical protein